MYPCIPHPCRHSSIVPPLSFARLLAYCTVNLSALRLWPTLWRDAKREVPRQIEVLEVHHSLSWSLITKPRWAASMPIGFPGRLVVFTWSLPRGRLVHISGTEAEAERELSSTVNEFVPLRLRTGDLLKCTLRKQLLDAQMCKLVELLWFDVYCDQVRRCSFYCWLVPDASGSLSLTILNNNGLCY